MAAAKSRKVTKSAAKKGKPDKASIAAATKLGSSRKSAAKATVREPKGAAKLASTRSARRDSSGDGLGAAPRTHIRPERAPTPRYLPIEEHGIIGDLHTIALVGVDGTIDWCCMPRFDSPAIFASILDADKGGKFVLRHTDFRQTKQLYMPASNVLLTRFLGDESVAEVADVMVPYGVGVSEGQGHPIIRRVQAIRGRSPFELRCEPAFNFGRDQHKLNIVDGVGAVFESPIGRLVLRSSLPLEGDGRAAVARFTLDAGEHADFFLEWDGEIRPVVHGEASGLFLRTQDYWHRWLSKSRYRGRWREMVERSALCLKLLTYAPTGALVAAPTTSLPEVIGGPRNWDYRYTWIRDAAFTLYGLMRLGFTEEAGKFMDWLGERCRETPEGKGLQIMYGIDGRHELPEETLDHFEGYLGSRPVRIGNGAADQLQLDIYGELMDSVYLFDKHGSPISYDLWVALSRQLDWLSKHWQEPDEGIWETRGGRQRFTYSALMTWVAFERAQRLARHRGLPAPENRWSQLSDAAYIEVQEKGWNPEKQAYTQYYGSDRLDASLLVMPLVKFSGPNDPRFLSTLDQIGKELVSDSLVMRYQHDGGWDGLEGVEGTFSLCSFWYVEALTRAGRLPESRMMFEKMLGYANHLGLYAEEIGPAGEALGNFPQAFTHLALISAAYNLDRALGGS
ncbi:MAG: glycoside hydrolase family 15 protein [Dehalococcoidia bacterium]